VLTSTGSITPPEVLCGQWNKTACNDVSPKPIFREFKHAVYKTVNGADDNVLWEKGRGMEQIMISSRRSWKKIF